MADDHDASHCKVHPHAAGARGGNQDMSRTKGAQHKTSSGRGCAWYAGQGYYYTRYNGGLYAGSPALIDGFTAEKLLADKGYDTDAILDQAESQGMTPVIPLKGTATSSAIMTKSFIKGQTLDRERILHLKRWRGIATRICEKYSFFLGRYPYQMYFYGLQSHYTI